MTEEERRHRRVEWMRPFLGEGSEFYKALKLMEKGLTDKEVERALALSGHGKRPIPPDVMQVLRALLNGTASRGTLGASAWHVGKDLTAGGKRERAFRLLDRGATRSDLMRELHIGSWTAVEYFERWKADKDLHGEG